MFLSVRFELFCFNFGGGNCSLPLGPGRGGGEVRSGAGFGAKRPVRGGRGVGRVWLCE